MMNCTMNGHAEVGLLSATQVIFRVQQIPLTRTSILTYVLPPQSYHAPLAVLNDSRSPALPGMSYD